MLMIIDFLMHMYSRGATCGLSYWLLIFLHAVLLHAVTQIKRTEGVSTTDIVGRMLTCTRANPHMTKEVDSQVGDLSLLSLLPSARPHRYLSASADCSCTSQHTTYPLS
jgi:hypothetical protein